jgi:hypothetical protein
MGTYGRYDFSPLPPLPFEMQGTFDWLANASTHESHIGQERAVQNCSALSSLHGRADENGITLPETFMKFTQTPSLHQRVRSNTDCFLDICPGLIASPIGDGYLVRFLADSQGCVFWYLYIPGDGTKHAVVSSPAFYGTKAEQWRAYQHDDAEIVFSAESFEAFICRFWLENELWLCNYYGTPMPEACIKYIDEYRKRFADPNR